MRASHIIKRRKMLATYVWVVFRVLQGIPVVPTHVTLRLGHARSPSRCQCLKLAHSRLVEGEQPDPKQTFGSSALRSTAPAPGPGPAESGKSPGGPHMRGSTRIFSPVLFLCAAAITSGFSMSARPTVRV